MESLNTKITGSSLLASEWNQPMSELQNIITAYAQVLSNADLNQVGKAIAGYVMEGQTRVIDSAASTADALVLIRSGGTQDIPEIKDGMVVRWKGTDGVNTGAMTLTVDGIGPNALLSPLAVPMVAGAVENTEVWYSAKFVGAGGWQMMGQTVSDGSFSMIQGDAGQTFEFLGSGDVVVAVSDPNGDASSIRVTFNIVHGFELFLASGTFNITAGVDRYLVTAVGAGGGGGGGDAESSTTPDRTWVRGGGQGGAGGFAQSQATLASAAVVIGTGGAGGAGGSTTAADGVDGGDTTFNGGGFLTAFGGEGGLRGGNSGNANPQLRQFPGNAGVGGRGGTVIGSGLLLPGPDTIQNIGRKGADGNYFFDTQIYAIGDFLAASGGNGDLTVPSASGILGSGGTGGKGEMDGGSNDSFPGVIGENGYVFIQW